MTNEDRLREFAGDLRAESLRLQSENKKWRELAADLVAWADYRETLKRPPDREILGIIQRARAMVTK